MSIVPFKQYHPQVSDDTWVHDSAVLIGQVQLGPQVSIWPQCTLRGDVHRIEIGARTNIQDGSICHVTSPHPAAPEGYALIVGNDVTVGHQAILHGCTIGDRSFIGMGAMVMDGAVLEQDVMLAAGSLVAPGKHLHAGKLYRGRPARPVRDLTDQEIAALQASADHYVELMRVYAGTS